MSKWVIVGICVGSVILFLFLLAFILGVISYSVSLKRGGLVGRIINKRFLKRLNEYGVDHSWWDVKDLEKLIIDNEGLKLCGYLLRSEKYSSKIAIIAHGYFGNHRDMQPYAEIFLKQGFNVFLPDARAHGSSEGTTVGMGWTDRKDYLKWIDLIIEIFGEKSQIVLFGLSMGASTVCMTAGEKLPPNVKCVISDCGFDSAHNEFRYLIRSKLMLSTFPIMTLSNKFSMWLGGYHLKDASTIKQVSKSNLPIFFIHGNKDRFVPTYMSHNLYHCHKPELREIYITEGVSHARSYAYNKEVYEEKVVNWVNRWVSHNNENNE